MEKKLFSSKLLLLAFMITLFSCDNPEDVGSLATISIDNFPVIDGVDQFYAVASDKQGKQISFIKLEKGKVNKLDANSYREETFTLSLVAVINDRVQGKSFHGFQAGEHLTFNEPIKKIVSLDLSGLDPNPIHYSLSAKHPEIRRTATSEYPFASFNVDNSSKIFVSKSDGKRTMAISYRQKSLIQIKLISWT